MSPPVSRPQRLLVTGGRGRLAALLADHFRAPLPRTEPAGSGPGTNTGPAAAGNGVQHSISFYSRTGGPGFEPLPRLLDPTHLAGAAALLHLAWSSLPATSEQSPGQEAQHDLPLLERLLAALAALPAAERPLFVFFSSGGAVYGNAPGRPSREDDACRPVGRYGAAKLAAEQLINAAAARHGLACAILRIANPYGYPVPSGRAQGVIPHAVRAAAEGRPLTLWGDGHARKDFLYYTDFLSAVHEVVARRLTGTFNVCAGESHSVCEIIGLVERHTGRKVATTTTPAPAWDVQDSRLDPGKFCAATGWQPQVGLDEGIRRSASGFFDHV